MTVRLAAVFLVVWASTFTAAQGPKDLTLRVVDVGPGLCSVTTVPGQERNHYMVYDAGHWDGSKCIEAVREIVDDEQIDLLILSHSDSDHLGDVPEILGEYNVRMIIQTGLPNPSAGTWNDANEAIGEEAKAGATVLNLQTMDLVPGQELRLGEGVVKLVAGWGSWDGSGPTPSEKRNAISIVAKLTFANKSILYAGDTVGRRLGDPDGACKDAEQVMVQRHNSNAVSLKSDVLIAPHHGGNNGSSTCFIEAVDPQFVIFSAGNRHQHPSDGAAQRYLAHGIAAARLFRTDRGDDEPGNFEWKHLSEPDCKDQRGDDDVDVTITASGTLAVKYRQTASGC